MRKQLHRNRFIALLVGVAALLSAGSAAADPPVRVVRLAFTSGPVSFSPAGENDWVQATVNRPLITGDRLWTDAPARAELQVGRVAMRMGSTTSVTLLNLDDRVVQLQLAQGALDIRVRGFDTGHVLEIDTPNLAFSILRTGDYRVDVDPAGNATMVLTRSGQAEVYGERAAYVVDAGAAYRFYGTGLVDYEFLDMPQPDDLDRWAFERDRRWDTSVSARYVSPEVIGYQDLDANGVWRVEAGYGNVWVPNRLVIGWAPYRDGHWAWIDPWGWTWVDNAPWGFAVSHYGRWASIRDTWCWVPGPVRARAVYAPALVAFVGGSNFQVAISGRSIGAVAWFPLGPRDVYRPAYPVSRTYFNSVNTSNTVDQRHQHHERLQQPRRDQRDLRQSARARRSRCRAHHHVRAGAAGIEGRLADGTRADCQCAGDADRRRGADPRQRARTRGAGPPAAGPGARPADDREDRAAGRPRPLRQQGAPARGKPGQAAGSIGDGYTETIRARAGAQGPGRGTGTDRGSCARSAGATRASRAAWATGATWRARAARTAANGRLAAFSRSPAGTVDARAARPNRRSCAVAIRRCAATRHGARAGSGAAREQRAQTRATQRAGAGRAARAASRADAGADAATPARAA